MISVIIPVYNREKTIKRAVESVLEQTYKNIEIIIVDDHSTDNSINIIHKLNDKRIKIFRLNENKGACYARNYGVKQAHGQYIAFQDSDDFWFPEKLEEQIKCLQEQKKDLVFCRMNTYNEKNTFLHLTPAIYENKCITYNDLIYGNLVSTQTILCKKEIFQNNQFDNSIKRFQDWDFVLQVAKQYQIYFLAETLVNQYIQRDSISNKENILNSLDIILSKNKEILNNKNAYSCFLLIQGSFQYLGSEKKVALKNFIKSFKYNPTINAFIRIFLWFTPFLKKFIIWRSKQ